MSTTVSDHLRLGRGHRTRRSLPSTAARWNEAPGPPATDASRATSEPRRGLPAQSVPSPRQPDEPVHTMIGDDSRPDLDRVVLGDVVLGRFHSTAARHRTPFGKERRDRLRAQAKPSARRCPALVEAGEVDYLRRLKSGPPRCCRVGVTGRLRIGAHLATH
jgi:hypothetical protein